MMISSRFLRFVIGFLAFCFVVANPIGCINNDYIDVESKSINQVNINMMHIDSKDANCIRLPKITPASPIFITHKRFHSSSSFPGFEPSFIYGTYFRGSKTSLHMQLDIPCFELIKETFPNGGDGVAYDIGANQGFYTYFLATWGFSQVHSFEIMPENFQALQHGLIYNPKGVSDRVNLYAMGISGITPLHRLHTTGSKYTGFLQQQSQRQEETTTTDGNTLTISMDCFAHHVGMPTTAMTTTSENNNAYISFVKIDVEGAEIDVLRGAHRSLLARTTTIGAMLIEVGPLRWDRAGIQLSDGIMEIVNLARRFRRSFILVRSDQDDSCTLAKLQNAKLQDTNPRKIGKDHEMRMFQLELKEFGPLLTEMKNNSADCNFWFTNR